MIRTVPFLSELEAAQPVPTRPTRPSLLLAGALLLSCMTAAPSVHAASKGCDLRLDNIDRVDPTGDYDPFAGAPPPAYHRFEVRHQNGPGCAFVIGFGEGENGGRRMEDKGSYLAYQLYVDAALTQPLTDIFGAGSGLLSGTLAGGSDDRAEFQFFSHIPGNQMVGSGHYRDRVRVTLYELEDGVPGAILDTRDMQVRTRVRQVAAASVVIDGTRMPLSGTAGILDFGEIGTGATRNFDLEVSGNGEYDLYLESENGGALTAPGGAAVPYQLFVDGQAVSISRAVNLSFTAQGTQRHGLQVVIPDTERALAGTYRDNLILTVTAR